MAGEGYRMVNADVFQEAGLKNVDQIAYARKNLVIGKNGSGKTRFLKAMEKAKKDGQTKGQYVVTLYFPEIQAFYRGCHEKAPEDTEKPSQEIYPFDLLLENEENSFYDFLKVMEADKGDFLENILSIASMKGTQKNRKADETLRGINDLLAEFLEKRIEENKEQKEIYIVNIENGSEVRRRILKEALSEFSPGELMLFYLCIFLIAIKRKAADSVVLIIDEPELHLHPRALVKMVRSLDESESVSEIWMASHSLFLVPLFAFEEIVFLQNSMVFNRNSKIYDELYNSLVGLENINIFEFLRSLDSWKFYQFIVECFCLPEPVAKLDIKDEQFCKLLEAVRTSAKESPIRMLDYGAGECRIWKCMRLLSDVELEKHRIIYTAYEPYFKNSGNNCPKVYTKFEEICANDNRFHVVVLMNVLHEIEVGQWEETFQNIKKVLTDDGVLVFLEVLSLTKGEQPYGNNGYLVLQDEQVKILFGDDGIINMRRTPNEKSNCWMISKKQVENVTKSTIRDSLISLKTSCYGKLQGEFQKRMDCAHQGGDDQFKQMAARKYAFLSQQYINASFAVSALGKSPKSETESGSEFASSYEEGGKKEKISVKLNRR